MEPGLTKGAQCPHSLESEEGSRPSSHNHLLTHPVILTKIRFYGKLLPVEAAEPEWQVWLTCSREREDGRVPGTLEVSLPEAEGHVLLAETRSHRSMVRIAS
ncbi:hypothetical protein NDU88_000379 [Pleurodeles waltl]|uniref:Uncharacterized protein n=1 Tax=Pleurodeles waltl TaxID=8319 RepID=A0AAV7Q3U5_PLEWA|nr:hypothetical protein NDU88_000379 [Pleurodeles waltl]